MIFKRSAKETSSFGFSLPKENSSSSQDRSLTDKYKLPQGREITTTSLQESSTSTLKVFIDIICSKTNGAILKVNQQFLKDKVNEQGSIACFATFKGKNRRFRYSSMEESFYKFLQGTFKEFNTRYLLKSYSFEKVSSFSNSKYSENKTWGPSKNVFSILVKDSFDDTSHGYI